MMLKAAPRPGHPVVAIGRVPGVAIGAAVGLPWHERLPIWPGPIVARQGRASIIVATHQGAVAIITMASAQTMAMPATAMAMRLLVRCSCALRLSAVSVRQTGQRI